MVMPALHVLPLCSRRRQGIVVSTYAMGASTSRGTSSSDASKFRGPKRGGGVGRPSRERVWEEIALRFRASSSTGGGVVQMAGPVSISREASRDGHQALTRGLDGDLRSLCSGLCWSSPCLAPVFTSHTNDRLAS